MIIKDIQLDKMFTLNEGFLHITCVLPTLKESLQTSINLGKISFHSMPRGLCLFDTVKLMMVIITHAIIPYWIIIHFWYQFIYYICISSHCFYFNTLQLDLTIHMYSSKITWKRWFKIQHYTYVLKHRIVNIFRLLKLWMPQT